MTRSRRDGDETEVESATHADDSSEGKLELRYLTSPAHAELQYRVGSGPWTPVPHVRVGEDEPPTVEGEATDVTGQARLPTTTVEAEDEKG